MRLNKYIAMAGIASRRKAEVLITEGSIKINGKVVTHLATEVSENDAVYYKGKLIKPETSHVYIMLNKPIRFITSNEDEHGRATVMDLLKDVDKRVFPVGRLDYNTSGLLLLTNDGSFAERVIHPRQSIFKTYICVVTGAITIAQLNKLRRGLLIDGYQTKPAEIDVLEAKGTMTKLEVKIQEGRNRQIRKMFEAIDCKVVELHRIAIGPLNLGHLRAGQFRKLTDREIHFFD